MDAEVRQVRRRPSKLATPKNIGYVVLAVVFLIAIVTRQGGLGALVVMLFVIWIYRGTTIWRYARRLFSRSPVA